MMMKAFLENLPISSNALVALMLCAGGLSCFFTLLRRGLQIARGGVTRAQARVIDKFSVPDADGGERYSILFEAGYVIRLQVTKKQYMEIQTGDRGEITFQKEHLISFE